MISTTLILAALVETVRGHGRLIKPIPRVGDTTSYENDPVGFVRDPAASMDQFICRHSTPSSIVTNVDAGSKLEVQWDLTAAHPGDCSFYISYDFDKSPTDMEWFKVANLMDCKAKRMHQGAGSEDKWEFELPSWLPGGRAVLRWEWSALHIPTSVEYFVQCVDINIAPTADAIMAASIPTYKVYDPSVPRADSYGTAAPGNGVPLTLPMSWNDMSMTPNVQNVHPGYGYSYRSAYNTGAAYPSFMTGPACALNLNVNNCDLTAVGTAGNVPMSESDATPVEVPTQEPEQPTEDPTDAPLNPTYRPTEPPINTDGECSKYEKYAQCGGDGFVQLTGPQYDGCSTCPAGTQCFVKSEWYSGCTEACPNDWDCSQDATQAPETTTSAPEPTTAEPEPTTAPAPGSCPNMEYDTCGGEGQVIGSGPNQWSGESCCQEGYECVVQSQWYSMCVSSRRMELQSPQ